MTEVVVHLIVIMCSGALSSYRNHRTFFIEACHGCSNTRTYIVEVVSQTLRIYFLHQKDTCVGSVFHLLE